MRPVKSLRLPLRAWLGVIQFSWTFTEFGTFLLLSYLSAGLTSAYTFTTYIALAFLSIDKTRKLWYTLVVHSFCVRSKQYATEQNRPY